MRSKNLALPVLILAAGMCVAWMAVSGPKTCSDGTVLTYRQRCDGAAASRLRELTTICARIVRHIDDSALRRRITGRWRGRVHELAEEEGLPAVASFKEHMRVCVADPAYDRDAVVFVMIHEMAHIGSTSTGHTDEFWRVMRHLLDAAQRAGVWSPHTHDASATVCGTPIGPIPK